MTPARQCRYCPLAWRVELDDSDAVLHESDTTCPRCGSDDAVPFTGPQPLELQVWSEYATRDGLITQGSRLDNDGGAPNYDR